MNNRKIAVIDSDEKNRTRLCKLLEDYNFQSFPIKSLSETTQIFTSHQPGTIIIDIDELPVSDRFFKELKNKLPKVHILGISQRSYHPEMKESITSDFYACLKKPVDIEELEYFLASIYKNNNHDETLSTRRDS